MEMYSSEVAGSFAYHWVRAHARGEQDTCVALKKLAIVLNIDDEVESLLKDMAPLPAWDKI